MIVNNYQVKGKSLLINQIKSNNQIYFELENLWDLSHYLQDISLLNEKLKDSLNEILSLVSNDQTKIIKENSNLMKQITNN